MSSGKKIIVSVSSDLSTDQRVQKICDSLSNNEFRVTLLGRKLPSSPMFDADNYSFKRYKLWMKKGVFFYANLNIRLFFTLLFSKVDVLYANDLDTLPANYLVSKLRGKQLIYDSHEYFTEVPELITRPRIQKIWEQIERLILPRLKNCITVTEKIAEEYYKKYNATFHVMRNFPISQDVEESVKENVIIYQGALNVDRGLEELILAMPYVKAKLWIAGSGDIHEKLKQLAKEQGLMDKLVFLGRLTPNELREYTQKAKIGVSIEHKEGLNYTYALPNKVFDYIHAHTPVLYSDLIEVKNTISGANIGEELCSYDAKKLGEQLNQMLQSNEYENWQKNCGLLKEKLNWQQEEKVLLNILNTLE